MAIDINDKLKYFEQRYFSNDEPVPFIGGLKIYPILIKDYYKFYSVISCFTMNKNEDNAGISMSNLEYIYHKINKDEQGSSILNQFITLLEMVFHVDYGLRCPKCNKVITYEEVNKNLKELIIEDNLDISNFNKLQYLNDIKICSECGSERDDTIKYIFEKGNNLLFVNNVKITKSDFDELRKIVCYQNIPDYDDEYIDPELKADLEEAARLRNPNNVQPSLEKQESCIVSSSSYTYDTVKDLSIRKFIMLLRTIDAKLHYFAYRQAEASGRSATMPLYIVRCVVNLLNCRKNFIIILYYNARMKYA